jgi:hypothetical protein
MSLASALESILLKNTLKIQTSYVRRLEYDQATDSSVLSAWRRLESDPTDHNDMMSTLQNDKVIGGFLLTSTHATCFVKKQNRLYHLDSDKDTYTELTPDILSKYNKIEIIEREPIRWSESHDGVYLYERFTDNDLMRSYQYHDGRVLWYETYVDNQLPLLESEYPDAPEFTQWLDAAHTTKHG